MERSRASLKLVMAIVEQSDVIWIVHLNPLKCQRNPSIMTNLYLPFIMIFHQPTIWCYSEGCKNVLLSLCHRSTWQQTGIIKRDLTLITLTSVLWFNNCCVVLHKAWPCCSMEFPGSCWICFCCCLCGIFFGKCWGWRRFWVSSICSSTCFKGVINDTNECPIWGVFKSLLDITTNAAIDLLET